MAAEFAFDSYFDKPADELDQQISLTKQLQDTRESLSEATSEIDQLSELIQELYAESRVENVATGAMLQEMDKSYLVNMPLPRNADDLSLSEMAGYTLYYMKYLGFATRKGLDAWYEATESYDTMKKAAIANVAKPKINRTGARKIPELDGVRELKSSGRSTTTTKTENKSQSMQITPPITPPRDDIMKAIMEPKKTEKKTSSRNKGNE